MHFPSFRQFAAGSIPVYSNSSFPRIEYEIKDQPYENKFYIHPVSLIFFQGEQSFQGLQTVWRRFVLEQQQQQQQRPAAAAAAAQQQQQRRSPQLDLRRRHPEPGWLSAGLSGGSRGRRRHCERGRKRRRRHPRERSLHAAAAQPVKRQHLHGGQPKPPDGPTAAAAASPSSSNAQTRSPWMETSAAAAAKDE